MVNTHKLGDLLEVLDRWLVVIGTPFGHGELVYALVFWQYSDSLKGLRRY